MRHLSKKIITVLVFFIAIIFLWAIYSLDSDNVTGKQNRGGKTKKIIYWTTYGGHKNLTYGVGQTPFIKPRCKVSNCEATFDRTNYHAADAIIFHVGVRELNHNDLPRLRMPNQKYIFYTHEPPARTRVKLQDYKNFFNATMTYSSASDILYPYIIIKKRKTEVPLPYGEEILAKKKHFALALISNCDDAPSSRNILINNLQKYIPLNVYGGCAKGAHSVVKEHADCFRSYNFYCSQQIISEYKFYFAFENSMCKEYVSRAHTVFELPVVPVVYGGANYSAILPEKSFINVRDFRNISEFVAHLNRVANDAKEYLSYFTWKKKYKQTAPIDMLRNPRGLYGLRPEPSSMCNLCEYLHKYGQKRRIVRNIEVLWGIWGNCFNPIPWLKRFIENESVHSI